MPKFCISSLEVLFGIYYICRCELTTQDPKRPKITTSGHNFTPVPKFWHHRVELKKLNIFLAIVGMAFQKFSISVKKG